MTCSPLRHRSAARRALLPATALLLLAACTDTGREETVAAGDAARDPGYSATGAEIIQTGADGRPRYRLQATRIEQDPQSLEIRLQELQLETREAQSTAWRVTAPLGRLSSDSRQLALSGGVQLESGTAGDGSLRLDTDELQYDVQAARARTAGEVRLTLQGHMLAGTGLDANLRTRQVRLNADVRGRFAP